MKKLLSLFIVALMLLAFTACGGESAESSKPSALNNIINNTENFRNSD